MDAVLTSEGTQVMSFSNGDRVYYISNGHGASPSNPLRGSDWECVGTVDHASILASGSYSHITVLWDNGKHNSYTKHDLIHADDEGVLNPNMAFRIKKGRY